MTEPHRDGLTWTLGDVPDAPEARVVRWPTGVLHMRLSADAAAAAVLLAAVTRDLDETLVTIADADDGPLLAALAGAGFAEHRREGLYMIPVVTLPHVEADGIDLVSAADVDLDRLQALDDALRQDIPGAAGWRWDAEAFRAETSGPDFDARAYLVAADRATGALVGLLRVWMRVGGPRLGCLAVLPGCRRTRVAAALLSAVAAELTSRGVDAVTTDVDDTNRAARALLRRAGARRTGSYVELVRPAR